jgi:DNA-binding Xre family transcriptional regulator
LSEILFNGIKFAQMGKTHRPDRSTLDKRGLTRSEVAKGAGYHPGTVGRIANNTMQRIDFDVVGRLCISLEPESLEDLLDTGGLLVWENDASIVLNVETYGESEAVRESVWLYNCERPHLSLHYQTSTQVHTLCHAT